MQQKEYACSNSNGGHLLALAALWAPCLPKCPLICVSETSPQPQQTGMVTPPLKGEETETYGVTAYPRSPQEEPGSQSKFVYIKS